jgi:hypothetical protein
VRLDDEKIALATSVREADTAPVGLPPKRMDVSRRAQDVARAE